MTSKNPDDFTEAVARFKALADERLARLRASARYESFLSDGAIDAFAQIDQSGYAGHARSAGKRQAS